ncbi:hypothetical protein Angca_000794, partial [Angiostrongylus cantonensis]
KWRVFFDIVCPNSWATFQMLQNWKVSKSVGAVEFVPISDVKLRLIRTYEQRMCRKKSVLVKETRDFTDQPKVDETPKTLSMNISEADNYVLPIDWEECHSSAIYNGSLLPAVFLSLVKDRYPEHFIRSIEVVGSRMWNSRLPICKGSHLFTCARESGLGFKDSDHIISTLSHVDSRQILHKNSEEALLLGVR